MEILVMIKEKNCKAFTLIELLVVVAIIGVLAAVGVVAFSEFTNSGKASATQANHKTAVKFINSQLVQCEILGPSGYLSLQNEPSDNLLIRQNKLQKRKRQYSDLGKYDSSTS
jgi:prepilin-type N-terminal cleavage/methylation domain-containing protein